MSDAFATKPRKHEQDLLVSCFRGSTQAIVDVGYGPKALELLKMGMAPAAIIKEI